MQPPALHKKAVLALLAVVIVGASLGSALHSDRTPTRTFSTHASITLQRATTAVPDWGTLIVGVKLAGGPRAFAGRLLGARVAVFNNAGRVVRVLHTKEGHTAWKELPPGTYTIGFGSTPPGAHQPGGCPTKVATVVAGHTVHYTLWFGCSYR